MVLFVRLSSASLDSNSGLVILENLKSACDKYVYIDLDRDEMLLGFSDGKKVQVITLLKESGFTWAETDPLCN